MRRNQISLNFPVLVCWLALSGVLPAECVAAAADNRPAEIRWANRTDDAYPPLEDFEQPAAWTVETENAVACFARADDRQLFGLWTGRLAYRAARVGLDRTNCVVRIRRFRPLALPASGFDCLVQWAHGTRFGRGAARDYTTPSLDCSLDFILADGSSWRKYVGEIDWMNWFPMHCRLTPEEIVRLRGAKFVGWTFEGGTQTEERVIHLDNLSFFRETFGPWSTPPRPQRNLTPLKGADVGVNTGSGRLVFPTRETTILPAPPQGGETPVPVLTLGVIKGPHPESLETRMTRIGKTLIVDFYAPPGAVTEFSAGLATEAPFEDALDVPYLSWRGQSRLAVDRLAGGLFRLAIFDWYRANAAWFDVRDTGKGRELVAVYEPKTDGTYNPVSERLFITLSDRFEDVLPTIPNPPSPYKAIAGRSVWRPQASSPDREEDYRMWREVRRRGFRGIQVSDHETMWRDGGESYTYCTNAAPGKGGNAALAAFSRFMREELGYRYGPYNNYVETAAINENWTWDLVTRNVDKTPKPAWVRTYSTKAASAPFWCERLAPVLKVKYGFNMAYCDVHTALMPWVRTDYDARVPGAGTSSGVFYGYGEVLEIQKRIWQGPVFSEGGQQFFYAGLTDGNYAFDDGYDFRTRPWLVDFDIMKLHPLEVGFGMGELRHFAPATNAYLRSYHRTDAVTCAEAVPLVDEFLAATLAFGHQGYLVLDWLFTPPSTFGKSYGTNEKCRLTMTEEAWRIALRSCFMVQAIAARYTQTEASSIGYLDANGTEWPTTEAIVRGIYRRNQVHVRYRDGTHVVSNGNRTDRLKAVCGGRALDLPPFGYAAWTEDGTVTVESSDRNGHRFDYCESPEYVYLDGRGHRVEMPKASGDGVSLVWLPEEGK